MHTEIPTLRRQKDQGYLNTHACACMNTNIGAHTITKGRLLFLFPEELMPTPEQLKCMSHYCSLGCDRQSELEALYKGRSQNSGPLPGLSFLLNAISKPHEDAAQVSWQVQR